MIMNVIFLGYTGEEGKGGKLLYNSSKEAQNKHQKLQNIFQLYRKIFIKNGICLTIFFYSSMLKPENSVTNLAQEKARRRCIPVE